ncbi:YqaA family protein [Tenacibaculum piscium]|uniref:Short-chain dehydrogenase n=1 Tax=Tenacibaculum piscium TaxID=1458515 RepID=A0A2H1YIH2_9FLAO|nr:VTT domain-containing protein [Tenacibaculum piscium]MBE7628510.1 short-chain dehydrogenase [Tenacibaculum piscium]MBE7669650.1 short-chain dehydrogenase [Tenacibaculum piscium]MBE7684761.1 short-chain dehydrogenase [Tenacibaculum piscium]MBE7689381.1 short-chain dehydrogenase [Tenacibaculum piscium]MCG8182725.1 VTT domain-containing protein [Tenacibaculum piscium]
MNVKKIRKKKKNKPHVERLHNYYHRTGFYMFIWESLKKAFWPIVIAVIGVFLFNKYVYNINDGLQLITETFSTLGILITFYISETILGLIPPEIFIAWSKKTSNPIVILIILATLSYLGGLTAYFIGRAALKINSVRNYLEVKMAKNLKNTSKWGGILILVGALLPLPFAISCLTAGMIKYPFKNVVIFGLFRFLRFAIYAWAIFSIVN